MSSHYRSKSLEAASIRLKDIKFKESKIEFRAEFTKTGVSRYSFMTFELSTFLREWIDIKYKERRLTKKNRKDLYVKPTPNPDDLVFSSGFTYDRDILNKDDKKSKISEKDLISNIYSALVIEFNKLVKQLKIDYESGNKRHVYTFHSFRRYYRTLISDLAGQDFAEWSIGHAFSTYWRKSEKEKYEIFKKIEPHLLILDQSAIQFKNKEVTTRLEFVEKENFELRQNIHKIMEMIQENPKLAKVKPEVLAKKKFG